MRYGNQDSDKHRGRANVRHQCVVRIRVEHKAGDDGHDTSNPPDNVVGAPEHDPEYVERFEHGTHFPANLAA